MLHNPTQSNTMLIGLTGGIGSGKSTIAKQLREMGYAVYDTDSEAKRLIVEDATVRNQMEQLFGKEVYADGVYQTALVAQRVFADHELLARLNAIVHPRVLADFEQWAEKQSGDYVVLESAILYESGFDGAVDIVVAIMAKTYDLPEIKAFHEKKSEFKARTADVQHPLMDKLFNEIAPKYAARKEELGQGGGYTRIYLLGERRGDGAESAIIELV